MSQYAWGFVGAGQMAGALIRGMIRAGVAAGPEIAATDVHGLTLDRLAADTGLHAAGSNVELARACSIVVLAVKPQQIGAVLDELRPALTADHLVLSIAAGVPISRLARGLGPGPRLIRVMPNTPSLVNAGAAGYCLGPGAGDADEARVKACLDAVGISFRVTESQLDALTGLSGSGPAYVYMMIDALSDGGVKLGLPRVVATALAAQTLLGGAKMVLETGLHPGALKDQVTSPGGTTIAGLHALERGGLRAALMDAVEASALRSAALAEASAKAGGGG